jgi:hypothetical protein
MTRKPGSMQMRLPPTLALLFALVSQAVAEPVDNCASLLGSISVELRVARGLPPGRRTTFTCPRDTTALLGASRQRILDSLGTPDATGNIGGSVPAVEWSYFFSSSADEHGAAGIPELVFSFDDLQQVSSIRCQRTQ